MKTGFFKSVLGLGITLAAFLVTTCDQPVALGQKVDLTAPVLVIIQDGGSLAPGAYIQGEENNIRVSAKDDSGIESVTVTYTYRYVLTQEDVDTGGAYEGQVAGAIIEKTKTVNARDYGNDIYGLDINSADLSDPMADGEVNVRITAKDGSGKEGVLSNQTYTVKNDPPAIELNIPKLALSGESRLDPIDTPLSKVTTGGFLSGSASDALAGVFEGYPKIQFWTDGSIKLNNQGIRTSEPDPEDDDAWIPVDSPKTWNSKGEKALEFRYSLYARDENGKPRPDVLLPGTYYLRVKVQDILGNEQIWPPEEEGYVSGTSGMSGKYYANKVKIEVQAAGTPPVITINPLVNQYQNKAFTLQASAEHTIGVAEMTWEVADPDFPTDEEKRIRFQKSSGGSISHEFTPGVSYTDIEDSTKTITLTDGVWTFYAGALSVDNTPGERSYDVYIDTDPPAVGITNVSPFVTDVVLNTPAVNQSEHEYTVNGRITVSADAPYDTMKNGTEPDGKRSRRYIVLKGDGENFPPELNGLTTAEQLYGYTNDGHAGFFDDSPTGDIAIASKTSNIVINTTTLYTDPAYWLYVFVIDKDAAGNAKFAYAKIRVDQATDKPKVVFSDTKTANINDLKYLTDTGEPGEYASSILDANARINISLEDDDQINGEGTRLRVWPYASGTDAPLDKSYTLATNAGSIVSYTITRQDLARAFTGTGTAAADDIPEGIYYFDIQTSDVKTGSQAGLDPALSLLPDDPSLFAIDTDFPKIGIDEGIRGAYQSSSFSLGAYAQDKSITEISITQPAGGLPETVTDGSPDNSGRWNFTHAITGIDYEHLSFTITAKDKFNKITSETVEVKYDVIPPKVIIENPVDLLGAPVVSSWVQGNIAGFSGKGTDWNNDAESEEGSNLKYVYYWIDTTGAVDTSGPLDHANTAVANYFPPLPVDEDAAGWTKVVPIDNQWQIYHAIREDQSGTMVSTVGGDGIKALYVIAIDNAGNWSDTAYTSIAGGKFGVDQGSPGLPTPTAGTGANKVGSSLYANGPFSFSFPAIDDNQLAPASGRVIIERAFNKGMKTLISVPGTADEGNAASTGTTKVWFTEGNEANKEYTYTLNESTALTDGVYDYTLTVKDAAGHQSSATFTLTVDKTPPTVNITRYQSTITRSDLDPESHEYVNDYIRINVTAADAGSGVGVDEGDPIDLTDDKPMAKWWFLDPADHANGTAITWATPGGTPFAATPLEAVINTKTIADGSDRKFYAIVRDNAGNESHIASTDGNKDKIVRVNQESDKPVINITYPLPNGFGDQNLTIQAAFSDDDGFEAGALEYRFLPDEGLSWPADTDGWKPLALQSPPPSGTSVPELNMSALSMEDIFNDYKSGTQIWPADRAAVLGAEANSKKIQIRATDSPINKVPVEGVTLPNVSSVKEFVFTLDYTAPEVDADFQANAIGTLASGAKGLIGSTWGDSFHISGTFKERNIQTINLTVGGFSAALLTVLDEVPATFPTIGGGIAGSDEDWTWYYSLDTTPENASKTIWDSLSDGPHSAQLVITDQVGQTAQHTVSFYKDIAPPVISFSNLSEERVIPKKLLLEAEDHDYVTGEDSDRYNDLTDDDVKGLDGFTEPADWTDKKQVHDAARAYYESARTLLANTIIRDTDPLRGVFADEYSAVGGGSGVVFTYRFDTDPITENYEDDPVYTLWREGTSALLGAPGTKSTSWRIDMPLANDPDTWQTTDKTYPLADGFHTLTIKVEDALGNKAVKKDIAFFLDREAPAIKLDDDFLTPFPENVVIGLAGVEDTDDVFVIKGTAADANLRAINPGQADSGIKISLPGYTGISFTEMTYNAGIWTWAAAVPKAAFAALGDGAHTITVTATDVAGRVTSRNWTFTKDAAPPAITFLNLDAAANTESDPAYFPNASDKILGVATDAVSPISALKYTIEKKTGAVWDVVAANGEIPKQEDVNILTGSASASKNWSIVLGPPSPQNEGGIDLADGEYRLKVTASDSAKGKAPDSPNSVDNDGKEWIHFIVDRTPPDMELTAPASANTYFNGPITFTGTAKDTVGGSGMDKVVLSVRNHPEISKEVEIAAFTGSNGDEWTEVIDPSALSSGNYTINIVAFDKAGHQTLRSKDIFFDDSPPVIEIESPAVDQYGTRVVGKTTIRGTSSDPEGGVAKMYYQIGKQEIETGTIAVTAMTPGGVYTIASLGNTSVEQWKAVGAKGNNEGEIAIGEIFIVAKVPDEDMMSTTGTVLPWKDSGLDGSVPLPNIDGGYPTPVTFDRGLALFTIELENSDLFVTSNKTAYDNGSIWGSERWEHISEDDPLIPDPSGSAAKSLVATLPIRLLAQDLAGNLGLMEYKVRVDTYLDRARTTILTPGIGATVGGEVRLSGTANDNNSINSVWVRVNGGNHGNAAVDADWLSWTDWDNGTEEWWDWGKLGTPDIKDDTKIPPDGVSVDSYGWHRATLTNNAAGVSNWYINLNPNGKLTPPEGVDERRVYIQVFTRDTKHLTDSATEHLSVNGYITQYILVFSDTVPVVEKVEVERRDGDGSVIAQVPYTPQMQISKTVKITAEVKDGEGLQSLKIQKTGQSVGTEYLDQNNVDGTAKHKTPPISSGGALIANRRYLVTVGGGDYTEWGGNNPQSANTYFIASDNSTYTGFDPLYEADIENNFVYTLEMELDTASLYPDATGLYDIQITATDNSERHLYTIYNINFQIDNYYPRGAYTGLPEVMQNYDIRGRATDVPTSGTVQGLKSVTVYFSRMENGQPVYYTAEGVKDNGLANELGNFTTIKAKTWDGSSLSAALGDIKYPVLGANTKPDFTDHPKGGGIVIDHDESRLINDNDPAADGDGHMEYWYDEGTNKIWTAAGYDSTILRDGKITVHFVIEDLAGNRTYQNADIFVKNKVPELFSLTLGTLVYESGGGEGPMKYQPVLLQTYNDRRPYSQSGFIARNNKLQVNATLRQNSGNNVNYYRVTYVERKPTPVNSVIRGRLYTIATVGATNFNAVGAPNSNEGTSFIATTSLDLEGGWVHAYDDYPYEEDSAYTGIKAGGGLENGTEYVVDFPGDTDWSALTGGTAHPVPGTTFTVSGGGITLPTGTGTAYAASELKVQTGVLDNTGGDTDIEAVFEAASFGSASGKIPDSDGTGNDRFFLIKVYDVTDTMATGTPFAYSAGAVEDDQLFDIILAGLRIENLDKDRPTTQLYDFNPKAETSRITGTRLFSTVGNIPTNPLQGGLFMENGKISGHIEPRSPGLPFNVVNPVNAVKPAPDNTSAWLELVKPDDDPSLSTTEFKPTGFPQDTLSGKVIIRGYAKDDQRIAAIWLKLGDAAAIKILDTIKDDTDASRVTDINQQTFVLDEYLGRLKPENSHDGPHTSTTPDVGVHDVLDLSGHEVWWAYVWDTEARPAGVVGDVIVEVIAEDKARTPSDGTPSTGSDVPGASVSAPNGAGNANINYNRIPVSRAPYISTLTRFKDSNKTDDIDKAVELRSRNGWYSFRRGVGDTEGLRVDGFNLRGTGNSTFNIDGTPITADTTFTGASRQYFLIPNNATSGILTVSAVSGTTVEAVNNRNNNDNSWNKESLAGNDASTLWTDDRYVHLFESHNIEDDDNQGHFRNPTVVGPPIKPAMTINPSTGELWASWSSYLINASNYVAGGGGGTQGNNMPAYYSRNNGTTAATPMTWSADPPEDTDISWNDTSANMVVLENYMQTDYTLGGLTYLNTNARTNAANHKGTWIERFNQGGNNYLNQFINPRIVNNAVMSHITYYDAKYQLLRYWNSSKGNGNNSIPGVIVDGSRSTTIVTGSSSNAAGTRNVLHYLVTVGQSVTQGQDIAVWYTYGTTTVVRTVTASIEGTIFELMQAEGFRPGNNLGATVYNLISVKPVAPDAGNYSSISLTNEGVPVIAYLVQNTGTGVEELWYAVGNGNAENATNFDIKGRIITGTTTAGRYVSMRVDGSDNMHIAYMDSEEGNLCYVKIPVPTAAGNIDEDDVIVVIIDKVGNVGKWADLTLDEDDNPYISYLDQGGIDSRTGLKMAFYDPSNTAFAASSGWEYVTLPGRYVVNDVRTQIEYDIEDAQSSWNAALAYVSGNYYRISYYVK